MTTIKELQLADKFRMFKLQEQLAKSAVRVCLPDLDAHVGVLIPMTAGNHSYAKQAGWVKMPKSEGRRRGRISGKLRTRDEQYKQQRTMQRLQVRISSKVRSINSNQTKWNSSQLVGATGSVVGSLKAKDKQECSPAATEEAARQCHYHRRSTLIKPNNHLFLGHLLPMSLLLVALPVSLVDLTAPLNGNSAMTVKAKVNQEDNLLFSSSLLLSDEQRLMAPLFSLTRAPSKQQQLATTTAANGSRRVSADLEEPKAAGSSSKFTRTNELDVFLDDMDNDELRSVAAEEPISDFFQPKPIELGSKFNAQPQQQQRAAAISGGANSGSASDTRARAASDLDTGSPSQPQYYSECALILQRTYVKNIDDPKHQLVPYGKTEQACISYKHIDKAVEQAKHQLKFRELTKSRKKLVVNGGTNQKPLPPFEIIHSTLEPPIDLIAAIGEINMATTQIIADQFDLSHDELLNGLPLIDMSKTKFWPICPLFVKQDIKCELTRFRTFTGHCNNLKHPTWGAAMTPFARYLPPVHPDGIWIPRKSVVTELTFDLAAHAILPPLMDTHSVGHLDNENDLNDHHNNDNSDHDHEQEHTRNILNSHLPSMPTIFHHDHIEHHHHIHDNSGPNSISNREMVVSAASSVQFVRHAHLDEQSGGPKQHLHQQQPAHYGQLSMGSNNKVQSPSSMVLERYIHGQRQVPMSMPMPMPPPSIPSSPLPPTPPLIGERLVDSHYQRSHSPSRPYAASATPISLPQPAQLHHEPPSSGKPTNDNNHRQQPLAVAATSLHHMRKSRAHVALELPSARLVTSVVHRDVDLPHHDFTILFMSWGQLLDHDMTRAAQSPSSIKCCNEDGKPKHKLCLPIRVPQNDPFYSKYNVQCLEFRRTLAGVRPNCVLGPRVHQNAITSPIDANFIYGSSQALAEALRLFKGGRLRDRNWFKHEGLKPILPAQDQEPDLDCIARPKNLFCFMTGDVRANEQTHLTVLHTLYMREHNRIADKLAELNPHWDDERIYQETRHIMAAGVQHVMINEYVPLLIGRKMTELYNLTAQPYDLHAGKHSYWHGYDPTVTTSVSNSFAAAAFRQGHTFVQGSVERYNKYHEFVASEKLRHLFKQPFLMYQPGIIDELTGGMINQPSQSYDPFISEDISGHLFQRPESQFGHDLAAINLQRGRDQGLPGYNLFREWCGLPRAETFEQLEPYLTNHTAYQYSRLYKHVDDIDLWSGGVSERKLPGAAIGPTFACIIARQFSNTRRGDRFWYENPGLPSSFTPEQLSEIRKITLAKILCANSDDLPTIQRWALRMPHPVLNPRIHCHELPEIDIQFWQEE